MRAYRVPGFRGFWAWGFRGLGFRGLGFGGLRGLGVFLGLRFAKAARGSFPLVL